MADAPTSSGSSTPTVALGIVGGGNMGHAIAQGILRARLLDPARVLVAEQDEPKHARLAALGVGLTTKATDARAAEQLLLAVKPQHWPAAAAAIGTLDRPTVVITIMAGIESAAIRARLGEHARVIRCMPNTPCQLGEGMTGIALGAGAQPGDDRLAREIFEALGRTTFVDESLMHAITAVSGSGPAYVYLLAELMQQAAREVGLDEAAARLLVVQTIIGAGRMLRETGEDPETLRRFVTTPGGTTAAAVDVFEERGLSRTVIDAIVSARDRGRHLGG